MKAALCKSLDGPDAVVVEDIPEPVPGKGEALVRVHAAALNFLDTLIVRGRYQTKPQLPFSPASEFGPAETSSTSSIAPIGDSVMTWTDCSQGVLPIF